MFQQANYTVQERIKSLSARLKVLETKNNTYINPSDPKVKMDNIIHNLTPLLSQIIVYSSIPKKNKKLFQEIIDTYNFCNNTNLHINDFITLSWIREINANIVLPESIRHFIWQIGYYEEQQKPLTIPDDRKHLVNCLQIFYKKYCQSDRLTINREQLLELVKQHSPSIELKFLVEKQILVSNDDETEYQWISENQFTRYLQNEIAAYIWILLRQKKTPIGKYISFLLHAGIYSLKYINEYLAHNLLEEIGSLSEKFLFEEQDIINSALEFEKIWLDGHRQSDRDPLQPIPLVLMSFSSPLDLIEKLEHLNWFYHGIFDYESSRVPYSIALKLIIENGRNERDPYSQVLKLLKSISTPYISWNLYNNIFEYNPEIIPYLLIDSELSLIALKQIDNIEITYTFGADRDKEFLEAVENRNVIWMNAFEITMLHIEYNARNNIPLIGSILASILYYIAKKVFEAQSSNQEFLVKHNIFRKRYDEVLRMLLHQNYSAISRISDVYKSVPEILIAVSEFRLSLAGERNNFLSLNKPFVDLSIECLKASVKSILNEDLKYLKQNLETSSRKLVNVVFKYLIDFFTLNEIDVKQMDGTTEFRPPERGFHNFGIEIIDWGFLFLSFERDGLLKNYIATFNNSIYFNIEEDEYHEHNIREEEKIKLFFKTVLLGYLMLSKEKLKYQIENLPVAPTLNMLSTVIESYAVKYNTYNLHNSQVDVFDNGFVKYEYNIYNQTLSTLFYQSLTFFDDIQRDTITANFFKENTHIGRMLQAINQIPFPSTKIIVEKRIKEIEFADYIDSRIWLPELQEVMIEAINSENHWELAAPLVSKISNHFKTKNYHDTTSLTLLYEVSLILAFKRKNFSELENTEIPNLKSLGVSDVSIYYSKKTFFKALHHLYNEDNYEEAIGLLKRLASSDAKNVRYAYHIYHAETLLALKYDKSKLQKINMNWDEFVNGLDYEEKKGLAEVNEAALVISLHSLSFNKEYSRFDQVIASLTKPYLFDIKIIPLIYAVYVERKLDEWAHDFIQDAADYFRKTNIPLPQEIEDIIKNSTTADALGKYRLNLERIRNLTPRNIALITPEVINNKRTLNEFVLHELIEACKVMLDKKNAISQITHEDRYTDLVLAILRLRFSIWGWTMKDQARMGNSPTGIDAGEVDLVIEAAGQNFALIEAFILKGANYSEVKKHVLKCFDYCGYLNQYYIITYYLGKVNNYCKTWESYQKDFLKIPFPDRLKVDKNNSFIDLAPNFYTPRGFKIAKTKHQTEVEIFHIMIDLSK